MALEDRLRVPPDRVRGVAVGSIGTGVAAMIVGRGLAVGGAVGWTWTVGVGDGTAVGEGSGVDVGRTTTVGVGDGTAVGVGLAGLEHPADITAVALNMVTRTCRRGRRGTFIPSRA